MARLVRVVVAVGVGACVAVALVAGVAVALGAGVAHGSQPRLRYGVDIQAVFDEAGDPAVVANFSPDGSLATAHWSICRPDRSGACRTVRRPVIVHVGPEPAGTVFTAIANYRGHTYRAGVTWHGRVQALTPPRVIGTARFGAPINAVAGTWAGGWGTEFDQLGLEACRTPDGHGCVTLSGGQLGCAVSSAATLVGGALTGMYLVALDGRSSRDEACAGVGWLFPAAIPTWPRRRVVSRSAAVGPVVGPPVPKVSILRRARVAGGRVLVASVRCVTRCFVWLWVSSRRFAPETRTAFTGTRLVGVPRAQVDPGPLVVQIHVDDGFVIRGRSRLALDGQGAAQPSSQAREAHPH